MNQINQTIQYIIENRCLSKGKPVTRSPFAQKAIAGIAPNLRNYDYDIRGIENLPDGGAIIMCNHSNSHDFFTAIETFTKLGLPVSVFAASDDLNKLTNGIFTFANATLIDRNNKISAKNGLLELANKVKCGYYAVIFGEATWNLHPTKQMQNLKPGGALCSLITGKPIVPTIFEYIETPQPCSKESELITKCVITFGKPFTINDEEKILTQPTDIQKNLLPNIQAEIFTQTSNIQAEMVQMRQELWREFNIIKSLDDKDYILRYINHTWFKKYYYN